MSISSKPSFRGKIYIPPAKRKTKKRLIMPISFSFVFVVLCFLASLYSLVSPLEAYFKEPPILVTDKKTVRAEIKDSIVAREASQNEITLLTNRANLNNLSVALSNLPLERKWPVRGRITTYFSNYHPAIDIAAPRGTAMFSFASGVVTLTKSGGNLGNHLIIAHNDGYQTLYAHLDRIMVQIGQQVGVSTQIGTVGSTGWSTGPHLHFQVSKNGIALNPFRVLP